MKSLTKVIKELKEIEKNSKDLSSVLYKVYENDSLIYIGIGGKGKRKASGRLKEHYKAAMPSSFKWKILLREWNNGKSPIEAESIWDNLIWEYELGNRDYIENKEKQLIKEYQPKYNIEFK